MRSDCVQRVVGSLTGVAPGRGEGTPLSPALRSFMESRFGVDFGRVRIHTGPWAAAAARALRARAFTLGQDIVFADGEYAPGTREGRRLLAHELVHVVQQWGAAPWVGGGAFRVGDPRDPCEAEADRVADQVLGTGPLAPITPAAAGVIRRAVLINAASATITIDSANANPAVHVAEAEPAKGLTKPGFKALLHLTRGAKFAEWAKDAKATGRFDPAIKMTGRVDVTLGPGDSLEGWNFGFLQVARLFVRSNLLGGRTPGEGSVRMNFAVPPALTKNPSLDSDALASPFTNRSGFKKRDEAKKGSTTLVRVEAETGDHPSSSAKLEYPNEAVPALNYMFNMRLDLELITVFVARENITAPLQPLAHFGWHLVWDARFSWKAGAPTGMMVNRRLDVGDVKLGRPADPNVQSLLTTPAPPFYNELISAANEEVLLKGKPPNRVMDTVRDKEIPADFFT